MAACLLRLGRLKWNSLGTLRRPPAAWFCIEAKEAANTGKKPKGPAKKPASAPPEPEEPFDNSTYKNYQHHDYTSYTFADLDVEMAKYRLPQPSSGKPSPTH
ncbi:PREDICTED: NADH dehydrogenase [ubiquinone] flavoprotein 3, mitochondrial isoform X3 [Cyprinodon variegatus]|uniref:NADH:ubiquinone oxidoreductase subunit V3 n=1 Tax=Cyprinodon variegatus TaxID=28743 RepID=A0A3Q2FR29_CYPVA|nr:PREDICTED: NADH dehydrogenase [ubiquinone] flavoprotein 3, mitochondrial isoform X3 [Cyprinodon variegatus]